MVVREMQSRARDSLLRVAGLLRRFATISLSIRTEELQDHLGLCHLIKDNEMPATSKSSIKVDSNQLNRKDQT